MAFDKVIDSAKLKAGMTATANAIREKTGSTDPIVWDESNGFKSAVEGIEVGGGGGSGVRMVQFTVTLENDSMYLPLDVLTEIPEMLSISTEWTNGDVNNNSVFSNKISSATVNVLPIKKVCYNSGEKRSCDISCIFNILRSVGIEWQLKTPFGDYAGSDVTTEQDIFVWTVDKVGYALDANGTLCIKNPSWNFGMGIPYFVTALYNVIPAAIEGYMVVDRTVNTANVTATV